MSSSYYGRATPVNSLSSSGSSSCGSRRSSKHQSVDSPPPTLPLAILNSSPETPGDVDDLYGCDGSRQQPQPLLDLKERGWSAFFQRGSPAYLRTIAGDELPRKASSRGDVMRLPDCEMGQYGLLPETDLFAVVVCDQCKAAVKPQGLQKHIHRHSTATASDVGSLASLITPCSVSVSALKFDPKADNSNSSTSSVYNMVGGGGSFEASSSSSSNHGQPDSSTTTTPSSFHGQDFMGGVAANPPSVLKSGGGGGSLKIKLSKQGLKGSVAVPAPPAASSRSTSQSPTFGLRPPSVGESDRSVVGAAESLLGPAKKLGLKEREYDPDKHCGVILVDTGRHCTRTLTCKSHALSLRRQVSGRSADFDKLLADHRALRASQAVAGFGKISGAQPPSALLPPPPAPSLETQGQKRSNPDATPPSHGQERLPLEPPPTKRAHVERAGAPRIRESGQAGVKEEEEQEERAGLKIKEEPLDLDLAVLSPSPLPFRGAPSPRVKPFHENGFELHGGAQLVAATNGGYFIKSEPQLAPHDALAPPSAEEKLRGPSVITVPLAMLGNVVYMNGRGCILEGKATPGEDVDDDDEVEGSAHERRPYEVVGAEGRRYLSLSSGRHQRATNRLRLNVIKTEPDGGGGKSNGECEQPLLSSSAEFQGIDTWYAQIPKPTLVNCFKLCKLGASSAVLSKRYLHIRKSLIMNIASSAQPMHHHQHHGHHQAGSPLSAGVLHRSNSQTGTGGSPGGGGAGCLEKVNFNVERIKV